MRRATVLALLLLLLFVLLAVADAQQRRRRRGRRPTVGEETTDVEVDTEDDVPTEPEEDTWTRRPRRRRPRPRDANSEDFFFPPRRRRPRRRPPRDAEDETSEYYGRYGDRDRYSYRRRLARRRARRTTPDYYEPYEEESYYEYGPVPTVPPGYGTYPTDYRRGVPGGRRRGIGAWAILGSRIARELKEAADELASRVVHRPTAQPPQDSAAGSQQTPQLAPVYYYNPVPTPWLLRRVQLTGSLLPLSPGPVIFRSA